MYTLTFQRSGSKHFQKALNHVHNLGGTWDGQTARLEIPEDKLMEAYEEIHFLFGYIQKWKSLRATFRGKPVHPYRFIFLVWLNVTNCKEEREKSMDTKHCWTSMDSQGWGCKRINSILRYVKGASKYKISNRYWYNFGGFIKNDTWKINKDLILQKIEKEIESKALHICPFFDMENVKKAVDSLPKYVRVDNIEFSPHYVPEYVDGKKEMVATNIRHVVPPSGRVDIQEIIYNERGRFHCN